MEGAGTFMRSNSEMESVENCQWKDSVGGYWHEGIEKAAGSRGKCPTEALLYKESSRSKYKQQSHPSHRFLGLSLTSIKRCITLFP